MTSARDRALQLMDQVGPVGSNATISAAQVYALLAIDEKLVKIIVELERSNENH